MGPLLKKRGFQRLSPGGVGGVLGWYVTFLGTWPYFSFIFPPFSLFS